MEDYLTSVIKQLEYYKSLGDKTFEQISDDALVHVPNDHSNSIAVIIKHLWGNMLSRWTDFLTSDGEKEWRNRDAEFESDIAGRDELLAKWEDGWKCVFSALKPLNVTDLQRIIYIRNQGHTIVEAINRQLAHYSYHVGQIVYIGKMLKQGEWISLSVPKGKSLDYNKEKFSKPKHREHFTDESLNDGKTH